MFGISDCCIKKQYSSGITMTVKHHTKPVSNEHQFQNTQEKSIEIIQEPLFNLLIKAKLVVVCYV